VVLFYVAMVGRFLTAIKTPQAEISPQKGGEYESAYVNETGGVYSADLDDIKARQDEIWVQQKEILHRLNKIVGAV